MRNFCDFVQSLGFGHCTLPSCNSISELFFHYQSPQYQLEESAKLRIQDYLSRETLYLDSFSTDEAADFALAFSFGDSECVNIELAEQLAMLHKQHPNLPLFAQQEIASHLATVTHYAIRNDDYQTTFDVAKSAKDQQQGSNVLIVAQAWHAKRCIETCQSLGLNVVGLKVVNQFPKNDPQPWVRNPINWIIKESHRTIATGYEVSQRYQLV